MKIEGVVTAMISEYPFNICDCLFHHLCKSGLSVQKKSEFYRLKLGIMKTDNAKNVCTSFQCILSVVSTQQNIVMKLDNFDILKIFYKISFCLSADKRRMKGADVMRMMCIWYIFTFNTIHLIWYCWISLPHHFNVIIPRLRFHKVLSLSYLHQIMFRDFIDFTVGCWIIL